MIPGFSPGGRVCGRVLRLSSRPERSLPLADGNAEWRDLLFAPIYVGRTNYLETPSGIEPE